jgi:ABC-type multidrug transport system ATPase subunit
MGSRQTALIVLRNLKKVYGRNQALDVDELTLFTGDRVLLAGNNGSGKSTLLRVLSGLAIKSRGQLDRRQDAGVRVAFVPQAGGMIPDMSLQQNLAERLLLYGIRDRGRAEAWLERSGLLPLRNQRFGGLSGGFQRLAALTAALCLEPSWLFIDEPLTGVDERRRGDVTRVLEEALPRLELLVAASPESTDSLPFINRVVSLKEGRINGIDR